MAKPIIVKFLGDTTDLEASAAGADSFLDSFGGKMIAGVAVVGAAAAAALSKGFFDAMDREALGAKFGAQLGLDSAATEQFIESSANVFNQAWGESLDEVANHMAAVSQSSFGADIGADLEALTIQALGLGDAFDIDVSRAIESVSQLMSEGMVDSGEEGFDTLLAVMQSVTPQMREEIFELSDEYDTHFADLGLSAENMFAVFASAAPGGKIAIDKVGDAIKELTIRGTDMSAASAVAFESMGKDQKLYADLILEGGDAAADALFGIVRGLQSIEDPVEQANAAIALFGVPLEDLGTEGIPAFLDSLATMGDGLDVVEGSAANLANAVGDSLKGRLTSLKREGLQVLADFATAHLLPAFIRFETWMRENWPQIQAVIQAVAAWIRDVAWPIFQSFVGNLIDIGSNLRGEFDEHWPQIQAVIESVVDWIEGTAWPIIQDVAENVGIAFGELVELVQLHWPQISEIISDVVEAIEATVRRVLAVISFIWRNYGDEITAVAAASWTFIQRIISSALDVIQGTIRAFTALLSGDWSGVWTGLQQIVSGVWSGIRAIVSLGISSVREVWSALWGTFTDLTSRLWDAIKDAIRDKINAIKNSIAGTSLYTVGVEMFNSLKEGIIAVLNGISGLINTYILGPLAEIKSSIAAIVGSIPGAGFVGSLTGLGSGSTTIVIDPGKQQENDLLAHIQRVNNPTAGKFHDGGWVNDGASGRFVASAMLNLNSDERLGILQTGEFVLSRDMLDQLDSGGGRSNDGFVNNNSYGPLVGTLNVMERDNLQDTLQMMFALRGQG